jgi:hypothetical protein
MSGVEDVAGEDEERQVRMDQMRADTLLKLRREKRAFAKFANAAMAGFATTLAAVLTGLGGIVVYPLAQHP